MPSTDVLSRYDAFLVDIDGVLVRGDAPIPGAREALTRLAEAGPVRLLTNNSTRSRDQHAERLRGLGFSVDAGQVLCSSYLVAEHLRAEYGSAVVWTIGEQGLKDELTAAGHTVTTSTEEATVVAVGMDRSIDYTALSEALDALRRGARFVATNEDGTFPVPGRVLPGAGAMVGALRGMGFLPDAVIGKPSRVGFDVALATLGVTPDQAVMIGDRLGTDIAGAHAAGIDAALVLSGISTREEADAFEPPPTWIADDLDALVRGAASCRGPGG